ncbi:hypothetical protein DRW03_15400 [Corallococcus sp. H22C18031201]|nr:hypothetical protein DRW03_15400 [Corallococcus sp. H22C18031201]
MEEPTTDPDAGEPPDAGLPDAGEPPDAGPLPDAGEPPDAGPPPVDPAGPWPQDPVLNYTDRYGLDHVQSLTVDAAHNIWLLAGSRIGMLSADTKKVVWTQNVGQAGKGYTSTVICGGAAGQAYVGYRAGDDIPGGNRIASEGEPGYDPANWNYYQQGDMDVVQWDALQGAVTLQEHLYQSMGSSRPTGNAPLGIHNSNDYHYDEDRSIYSCARVMRGPYAGEVYIGTNHGVTRIRGLTYSSHRHPVFWVKKDDGSWSQRTGLTYGLGIGQDGAVLIGNDWKIGIIVPNPDMALWHFEDKGAFYTLNTFVEPVNGGDDTYRSGEVPFAFWRAFEQTKDGAYYVGSHTEGLFRLDTQRRQQSNGAYTLKVQATTRVEDLGSRSINALAATDDGSLFVGTDGDGLWRIKPDRTLEKVSGVKGGGIQQLLYDPTVTPSMLFVRVNSKVYVLRGY